MPGAMPPVVDEGDHDVAQRDTRQCADRFAIVETQLGQPAIPAQRAEVHDCDLREVEQRDTRDPALTRGCRCPALVAPRDQQYGAQRLLHGAGSFGHAP